MTTTILLTNHSKRSDITAAYLNQVAIDFTTALHRDFCPDLNLAQWTCTMDPNVDPNAIELRVDDVSNIPDAGGYHDMAPDDVPEAFAFVEGETLDEVSVIITHEGFEVIKDTDAAGFRVRPSDGTGFADEESDAVEDTSYRVGMTDISNYVLQSWYVDGSKGPWDKLGVLQAPHTRTPGGYIIKLINGQYVTDPPEAAYRKARKSHPFSRTSKRLLRGGITTTIVTMGDAIKWGITGILVNGIMLRDGAPNPDTSHPQMIADWIAKHWAEATSAKKEPK